MEMFQHLLYVRMITFGAHIILVCPEFLGSLGLDARYYVCAVRRVFGVSKI